LTTREAFFNPEHDDASDGELSSSYGAEYQDSLKDRVLQAIQDDKLERLIEKLCFDLMSQKEMTLLTRILCLILQSEKPGLTTMCVCIACGLETLIEGQSGQTIGAKYDMTRQNVNVLVKGIREQLNLSDLKTRTSKSAKARASYKTHNKGKEKK